MDKMQKKRLLICLFSILMLITALSISPTLAQTPVEVTFWHAMSGNNGKVVTDLVAAFNASQTDIHVTEQNKGNYDETLNAVIQASGQQQGPNITQIFD